MQFEKPKLQRAYITATDPETRKSVSFTVYGVTPDEFKEQVQRVSPQDGGAGAKHGGQRTRKTRVA
jgi:hypothetical protein